MNERRWLFFKINFILLIVTGAITIFILCFQKLPTMECPITFFLPSPLSEPYMDVYDTIDLESINYCTVTKFVKIRQKLIANFSFFGYCDYEKFNVWNLKIMSGNEIISEEPVVAVIFDGSQQRYCFNITPVDVRIYSNFTVKMSADNLIKRIDFTRKHGTFYFIKNIPFLKDLSEYPFDWYIVTFNVAKYKKSFNYGALFYLPYNTKTVNITFQEKRIVHDIPFYRMNIGKSISGTRQIAILPLTQIEEGSINDYDILRLEINRPDFPSKFLFWIILIIAIGSAFYNSLTAENIIKKLEITLLFLGAFITIEGITTLIPQTRPAELSFFDVMPLLSFIMVFLISMMIKKFYLFLYLDKEQSQ